MNDIEQKYVYDTYKIISKHFNDSRAYLWESVKNFIKSIPNYSIILEVGSGNGKNLNKNHCFNLAIDLCPDFCKISKNKNIETICGNNLQLPNKDNSIDYILSIAVVHHLSSYERRLKCISELIRVLKPNGRLLIQVWALEQPDKSRRKFVKQENLVEYKSPDKTISELRYYYVFKKGELEDMLKKFNVKIVFSKWEYGNWVVLVEKFN